jgi:uncharacterized protein YecE (DUF72 family)
MVAPHEMTKILTGTSSWTDKTLIECGRFYPAAVMTPEERLRFYASQFPIVEIDSSYYGIPSVENAKRWVERTPPGFIFNIKGYRLFTRHQTPVISLGKEAVKALKTTKKTVYDKDVPDEVTTDLWRQFRAVLEILRDGGKLGAVHMQFAPWVAFHPQTFAYLEHCRAMLAGFTVAVEFRNVTWFNDEKHVSRTLEFERTNGFVNVVVDEPKGIPNTVPAVWEVTNSTLVVVRLHGRNHGTWNKKGLKASSQRFDYDYSEEELRGLAGDIKLVARKADTTHVLFNNNYGDQGQRGARTLIDMLKAADN